MDLGKLEYFLVQHNTWIVVNGPAAVWSRLGNISTVGSHDPTRRKNSYLWCCMILEQQNVIIMETPLQIFNQGIQNHSVHSVSGRSFVLTRRLKSWLKSTVDGLRPQTVLENLYNTIVPVEVSGHLITPPWKSDSVLIFCILLELGLAHLLEEFATNGTSDKSLPIDKHDLRVLVQNLSHEDDSLADRFFEIQWRYCAAVVDLDGIYEWQQEMVIPICFQSLIAEGRTAKVYEIAVPEDFIGQRLAHRFPHCRRYLDSALNICPGWVGQVLLNFPLWVQKLISEIVLSICVEDLRQMEYRPWEERNGNFPGNG